MEPAAILNLVSSLASSWGAAKVMMATSSSTSICRPHGGIESLAERSRFDVFPEQLVEFNPEGN
jgi:hypothetical protein